MHQHAHPAVQSHDGPRRFLLALLITLGFACIEFLGGLWSGSLALMGDAGHMATDAAALGIAAAAAWLARRPASARHSFGFGRMEVLAALINTLCMLAIVVGIVVEAILRLSTPEPVKASWVMLIALTGLVINVVLYRVLQHGAHSLNL
ncbi:MAG TPA: cation diffusion facilitator family transporter, partial [Gammaproteobacteria bacterium]|nr:cation diffusion facilitator family transporter [Gammaproteobacteria bacterium]